MVWSEPFSCGRSVPQCTLLAAIDENPPIAADSVQSVAGERHPIFTVWAKLRVMFDAVGAAYGREHAQRPPDHCVEV